MFVDLVKISLPFVIDMFCWVRAEHPWLLLYGTQDAGRKFWQRFSTVIKENDFAPNKFAPALYSISKDGDIKGLLVTHVDDLGWAVKPGYEANMKKILDTFSVRKVEEGEFRFCGKEIKQLENLPL